MFVLLGSFSHNDIMLLWLLLFLLSEVRGTSVLSPATLVPFGIPAELGKYMIDTFAKDEKARTKLIRQTYNTSIGNLEALLTLEDKPFAQLQNLSFRLSTTPFVTTAGFRDMCFPNVLDNNGRHDLCMLPSDPASFFGNVKDGACIFMTTRCYFTVMKLDLLRFIPHRFSIVTHSNDIASPDMDVKKKGLYGDTQTSPALQKLYEKGKLLSFHAMNMHYSKWHAAGVRRPPWLHCLPIGMRARFYQPQLQLKEFVTAIRRNVVDRPRAFWSDSNRPLLLVPIIPRKYAPDRAKAIKELENNVRKKALQMTRKTYANQNDFFNAISNHRFTLCPWGNGLDTHRMYEVLAMGGIPVVRVSSINSCLDSSDNNVTVTVVDPQNGTSHHFVTRGGIPFVRVRRWSEVTSALLEAAWTAFTETRPNGKQLWDYSRITMQHWQQRILGPDYASRMMNSESIKY